MSGERWIMAVVGVAIGIGVLLFVIFGLGVFSGPEPVERSDRGERDTSRPAKAVETTTAPRNEPQRPNRRPEPAPQKKVEDEAVGYFTGRVVTSEKKPVAGAEVHVSRLDSDARARGEEAEVLDVVGFTKDDGTFAVTVPAGQGYILAAAKSGYAEAKMIGLAVDVGETRPIRDMILFEGGRIFGIVTDADGGPISGATVVASVQKQLGLGLGGGIARLRGESATTDGSGFYEIRNVPPGVRHLYAAAEGYAPEVVYDVTIDNGGEDREENFDLSRGLMITGHVYDLESNVPVEGAQVTATPVRTTDPSRGNAITDASGYFELTGLSKYAFHVQARKKGYVPSHRNVSTHEQPPLEVFLTRNGGVQGQVLDLATGQPVESFTLRFGPVEDKRIQGIGRSVSFDDGTGNFEIYDLNPEAYIFEAYADGYSYAATEPVPLGKGEWVQGLVIQLGRGGEVTGSVTAAIDGAPVAGVLVEVRPDDTRPPFILSQINPHYVRSARTGSDGRFQVGGIGPGKHRIDVSHDTFMNTKSEMFEIGEGGSVDVGRIEILRGGAIEGYVTLGSTPVPFAQILIDKVGGGYRNRAKTDDSGYYSLDKIPAGTYSVQIERVKGKMRSEVDLAAYPAQTVTIGEAQTVNASW